MDDKEDIRNVPKYVVRELICTYKSHPALWQIKNKDLYGNRTLKYRGYQALVNVWKKYDEDADIKMVKNKIQSLRGSFRKELRKIQNSQRSGSGTEDIYKSQLWYFSLMSFLKDQQQPTRSVDNLDEQELTQEAETRQDNDNNACSGNEEMGANTTATNIKYGDKYMPAKKKMKVEGEEKRKFIKAYADASNASGNKDTDNDAFGKFISRKFDKISSAEQKMYAESLITKVVNYAILNKLTEFTDVIGNYSFLRDTNTELSNYSSSPSISGAHQPTMEIIIPAATLPNSSASE